MEIEFTAKLLPICLFNPQAVAGLLQEHNRGVRDHAHSLWALLMLEVWRRMFIDREPAVSFTGAKGGAKGGG